MEHISFVPGDTEWGGACEGCGFLYHSGGVYPLAADRGEGAGSGGCPGRLRTVGVVRTVFTLFPACTLADHIDVVHGAGVITLTDFKLGTHEIGLA